MVVAGLVLCSFRGAEKCAGENLNLCLGLDVECDRNRGTKGGPYILRLGNGDVLFEDGEVEREQGLVGNK